MIHSTGAVDMVVQSQRVTIAVTNRDCDATSRTARVDINFQTLKCGALTMIMLAAADPDSTVHDDSDEGCGYERVPLMLHPSCA